MNNIILLCGISGSGKTSYARNLEAQGYLRLSADEIAWRLFGNTLVSMNENKQKEAFLIANSELIQDLKNSLIEHRDVVVDSTLCRRRKRDEIRDLCRRHGIEPRLIYFKASYEVLAERLKGRKGSGANDQIVSPERLQKFCKGFEPPTSDENAEIMIQH